jgi:PASTA domain
MVSQLGGQVGPHESCVSSAALLAEKEIDVLRTGTIALAAGIAALFLGGVSAQAAVEAPPANDNLASAISLFERVGAAAGSNIEATKELGEPEHAGVPGGASVWYRWNSTQGGRAHFSTCEGDFDTVLAVYTGVAVNALTPIASSNDDCFDTGSMLSFPTVPNTDYWIAIDGVGAATGAFLLEWFQRPHNDDRSNAEVITGEGGTLTVSNEIASLEEDEPQPAGPGGSSVWYSWTAPSSGPVRFDTCASAANDTLLAAYEGGSTTALAANDDFCATGSLIAFTAEAGKEYLLSGDGYDGEQFDDALLNWSRQGAPPSPPASVGRPEIAGNPLEGESLSASDGSWSGTAPFTFSYEWARCNITALFCQTVPGAVARTYALGPADVSFRMRVFVTASNSVGSATMNSSATAPIVARSPGAPRNTTLPTIAGTPAENQTLTATAGSWDAYPPPLLTFQWQRCTQTGAGCEDIDGEIEPTLVLSPMEAGRRVRVVVLARNSAGASSATSELTAVVRGTSASRPRPRCVVPNVRGKRLVAARKAITKARCRVGRVTRSWSARVAAGKVIKQRPAPRTRLAARSRVHLVVSRGRRR